MKLSPSVSRSACGRQGDRETYLCLKALSPEEVNASIPYHSWMNTARWGLPDKDETTHPLLVVDGENWQTHEWPVFEYRPIGHKKAVVFQDRWSLVTGSKFEYIEL